MRLIPCPECKGTGRLDFDRCPECAGVRTVEDYSGTRQLGALLFEHTGSTAALELLLEHPALLLRWLDEQSVIFPTEWVLSPSHKTDDWGHAGQTEWLPVKSSEPSEKRLWRVKA